MLTDHHYRDSYLGIYTTSCALALGIYACSYLVFVSGSLRASKILHDQLSASIFGSTLRWLDSTPVGRIMARFVRDIRAVDGPVAMMLQSLIGLS